MDIRKLQRAIVDGLEDIKAQDILVFNTEHLSPLFERVIIASGTSNRQTKALASGVRESVKAAGFPVLATEGGDNGEWIIVDCGAAVAHIMQPAIRDYYRLEEIWGGKPVKMKMGERSKGLVKASEPAGDDEGAMAPERKAAARKSAAAKAPSATGSAAGKRAASQAAAGKRAAGRTASRKTAPPKTAAVASEAGWNNPGKTAPRKKAGPAGVVAQTVVVKAPARKTATAKAPARKAAPGRAAAPAARKTAARKAPARRG